MENSILLMGNGKQHLAHGKWKTASCSWEMENSILLMGNGKQHLAHGKWKTASCSWAMENSILLMAKKNLSDLGSKNSKNLDAASKKTVLYHTVMLKYTVQYACPV
jgi:hypothetical protein